MANYWEGRKKLKDKPFPNHCDAFLTQTGVAKGLDFYREPPIRMFMKKKIGGKFPHFLKLIHQYKNRKNSNDVPDHCPSSWIEWDQWTEISDCSSRKNIFILWSWHSHAGTCMHMLFCSIFNFFVIIFTDICSSMPNWCFLFYCSLGPIKLI